MHIIGGNGKARELRKKVKHNAKHYDKSAIKKHNDKTLLSYIVVIATKPLQLRNTQKTQIVEKNGSNAEEVKRKKF